jgi:hypothetical protein
MWHQAIPTNYRLWAAIAFGIFVGAGCINWVPESKALAYWPTWWLFVTGKYACPTEEFVFVLAMWGVMLAIPAVILGWVGQAVWQVVKQTSDAKGHSVW